mmetsp:Transcript_17634/g.31883  ORF Transcript_17634/g.31883 Transcript_17634/m.31883 type:complete len:342 (+) Transcript_17634:1507-2532(+)
MIKYSNCLHRSSSVPVTRTSAARNNSSMPCSRASIRMRLTPSSEYRVPFTWVRTCGFGCSMRHTSVLQPPHVMQRLLPAVRSVRFMSKAEANSSEKSIVSLGLCLNIGPLSMLSSEFTDIPMRFRVCKIQSMAPSSIIFICSALRKESRCKTARHCICTGDDKRSRPRMSISVLMHPGVSASASSISFRPTASHEQTANTASDISVSAASPPTLISGKRCASALGPPKHAKAARKVLRGRKGSSGDANRRNTAHSTAWMGGMGSLASSASGPCCSYTPAITAAIWPKSRAGGTGSGAVAVRALDSKLLALEIRFCGERMPRRLEADPSRSATSRDAGHRAL